ncbi:MAG: LysR family transcriptional regulator [Pseudomonadota bacterium]|nr:LysR family transcriptional regulator [Pseudomonadota bacterium]
MKNNINLNDLAVFNAVVDAGSLSRAAQSLDLPKATVSRTLQRLENMLAVRLLHRTTRSMRLTEAGELLYQQSHYALQQLDDTIIHLQNRQQQPEGHIRLTMPVEIGMFVMGEMIADFMQRYPQISLDIELSSHTANLIEEGFDLALRLSHQALPDSSLIALPLGELPLYFYASPQYLSTFGTPKHLFDLSQHDCILFKHIKYKHLSVYQHRSATNTVKPTESIQPTNTVTLQGRLLVDHLSMVKDATIGGIGIGLIPPYMCRLELAQQRLIPILSNYYVHSGQLLLIYPSRQHQPIAIKTLIEFMTKRLKQHPLLC